MKILSTMMYVTEEGVELSFSALVPGAKTFNLNDFADIVEFFGSETKTPPPPPEPEPTRSVEPEKDTEVTISDTQLLDAVSKAAEKIGSEKAKEIVKSYAKGRGRPSVKNIPAEQRDLFITELKSAMVNAGETGDEAPAVSPAPTSTGSRRRRN